MKSKTQLLMIVLVLVGLFLWADVASACVGMSTYAASRVAFYQGYNTPQAVRVQRVYVQPQVFVPQVAVQQFADPGNYCPQAVQQATFTPFATQGYAQSFATNNYGCGSQGLVQSFTPGSYGSYGAGYGQFGFNTFGVRRVFVPRIGFGPQLGVNVGRRTVIRLR